MLYPSRSNAAAMLGSVPAARVVYVGLTRTVWRITVHLIFLVSFFLGDDVVGRTTRLWVLRAAGAHLAAGVTMHSGTYVSNPLRLVVGAGSFVNRNCYLDLEGRLVIGRNVTVGNGTSFITTRHQVGPHDHRCGAFAGAPITVGDGAWLGANVTVLSGVSIGAGAVVAAGAVVNADVPPNTLVAGVPARVRRAL